MGITCHVVYTLDEIAELEKLTPEEVRRVHSVKKAFKGEVIKK